MRTVGGRARRVGMGAVAMLALLTGCGLGGLTGSDEGAAPLRAEPSAVTPGPAEAAGVRGRLDFDALSDFRCGADPDGRWVAEGRITNTSGRPASYLVTVVVADDTDVVADGLRQRVAELSAGDSVALDLPRLPAAGVIDPTCQVQVVRRSDRP